METYFTKDSGTEIDYKLNIDENEEDTLLKLKLLQLKGL